MAEGRTRPSHARTGKGKALMILSLVAALLFGNPAAPRPVEDDWYVVPVMNISERVANVVLQSPDNTWVYEWTRGAHGKRTLFIGVVNTPSELSIGVYWTKRGGFTPLMVEGD